MIYTPSYLNLATDQINASPSHCSAQLALQGPCLLALSLDVFPLLQKRGLENTLQDAKHWHDLELQNLGAVVHRLEAELQEMRAEAEQQQQTREHLLAHRCQLQRDVASYHVLLDREESR